MAGYQELDPFGDGKGIRLYQWENLPNEKRDDDYDDDESNLVISGTADYSTDSRFGDYCLDNTADTSSLSYDYETSGFGLWEATTTLWVLV